MYVHVPCAWMSLFAYGFMAINGFIALVWRIKLSEILAMASAPVGAAFTFVTLVTGSLWGKPRWGPWWTWDARLPAGTLLLFLYLGVWGRLQRRWDRRRGARSAGWGTAFCGSSGWGCVTAFGVLSLGGVCPGSGRVSLTDCWPFVG